MRTIIKITKQEAIDAWKKQNTHISTGEDTTIEIEEVKSISVTGNTTLPINTFPYQGGIMNC